MKNGLIKFCTSLINVLLFHNLTRYNLVKFGSLFKKASVDLEKEIQPGADKTLCFLLGSPRSGTTLSSVLLDKSPQIFSPPELFLATFENLQQRTTLMKKTIYKSLTLGLAQCLSKINKKSLSNSMATIRYLESSETSCVKMYNYLLSKTSAPIFLDKTPCYLSYVSDDLFCKRFPSAKYIYVHRHPLSVILSQKKWFDALPDEQFRKMGEKAIQNFSNGKTGFFSMVLAKPEAFNEFESYKMDVLKKYDFNKFKIIESWWRYENQRTLDFLEKLPAEQKYIYSYESLVQQPEQQLTNILNFLGADTPAKELIEAYESRKAPDSIPGILGAFWNWEVGDPNQIFMAGQIDSNRANDWRNHSGLWQELDEETRQLARRMGYADPQ